MESLESQQLMVLEDILVVEIFSMCPRGITTVIGVVDIWFLLKMFMCVPVCFYTHYTHYTGESDSTSNRAEIRIVIPIQPCSENIRSLPLYLLYPLYTLYALYAS